MQGSIAGRCGWLLDRDFVRIADIAAVESTAHNVLAPSIGERLVRVVEVLSRQQHKIESVELVDPMDAFPKRWREVLGKLPIRSVRSFEPAADANTVLGKLQIALKSAHQSNKKPIGKIAWSDDGSLRVVRAETGLVAARWVAQTFTLREEEVAIVAEQDRSLLDATLDAVDIARQGFQDSSPLAPALQVLPLALATIWEPLDVYALLQFLSHPIGQVPGYARRRLAEVIAERPGIGGPRWREAIGEIEARYPDRAADFRKAVSFWVEHPRYNPAQGAPVAVLLERTRGVRDYSPPGLRIRIPFAARRARRAKHRRVRWLRRSMHWPPKGNPRHRYWTARFPPPTWN